MRYWLFKSEPENYGLDRLERDGRTEWSGVRNYQARNTMREMRAGDLGFFYHSSTKVPGIAGVCKIVREAYPDFTALDAKSAYFDAKATPERPIWEMVDVAFERTLERYVSLEELRAEPALAEMMLLRRGSRLSVQPVSPSEWKAILTLAARPAAVPAR